MSLHRSPVDRKPDVAASMSRAHRRHFQLTAVATCALMGGMLIGATRTSADDLTDRQSQRSQLNGIMQGLHQQLAQNQNQEAVLQNAIAQLDGQITLAQRDVDNAQNTLINVEQKLTATQAQLDATRIRLQAEKLQLAQELVFIYKQSASSTTVSNLLGSDNFNDFWVKLIAIRRISDSQSQSVNAVQNDEQLVTQQVATVNAEKQRQVSVVDDLQYQEQNLKAARADRANAENQLVQVQAQDQQRLADAEKSAQELDSEIAQIEAARAAAAARASAHPHGTGNGKYAWPELGPITQDFGCTTWPFEPYDPSCSTRHFHTGIDIGAQNNNPITAAAPGTAYLYYSSYGYGDHIIIDHGDGWVTVYGHMHSNFTVTNGQYVNTGQQIGWEGSTGNSSGPHLHFEVRDPNGNPQNPIDYLP